MSIPYLNGRYLLPFIVNGRQVKHMKVNGQDIYFDQPITFSDPVAQQVCAEKFGINGHITFNLLQRVYAVGSLFKNRTDLITFNELQSFNNLQTIGDDCFNGCTNLTDLKIPQNVTTILPRAFKDCTSLATDLWIPKVSVVNREAFRGCIALKKIEMGTNISVINALAFADCDSLENLTMHAFRPPQITADILQNSPNCMIYVYSRSLNSYKSASGWSDFKDRIFSM